MSAAVLGFILLAVVAFFGIVALAVRFICDEPDRTNGSIDQ